MKIKLVLISLMMVSTLSVFAAETPRPETAKTAPADAPKTAAPDATAESASVNKVHISDEDCELLLQKTANKSAAYVPGVDVRGNAVKPADGNGEHALQPPTDIVIDFGIDLAGKYGISAAAGYDAVAGIGEIQYDINANTLTFNGKPLTQADQTAVEKACGRAAAVK